MPLDPTILDARDEADRFAQQMERASADLAPVTGDDETSTVHVRLDARGTLEDVRIEGRWVEVMEPDDLGAAVMTAIAAAGARRTALWAENFARAADGPTVTTRPLPRSDWAERLQTAVGGRVDGAALARAIETLGSLSDMVDELDEQMQAALTTEHRGSSSSHRVTATAQITGAVLSVSYDPRWVPRAHAANLSRETTEACRNAVVAATATGIDMLVAQSRLGRLQALMEDPEALARAINDHTL